MRGVGHDAPAVLSAEPVQFDREHQRRALGLGVGGVGRVAALEVGVLKVDPADPGGQAAQRHHSRALRGPQQWQQVCGQGEVAQMVGTELQFESFGGGVALWRLHDAGVVHQDVDRASFGIEFVAEGRDAGQRRQVDALEGQLRGGHRGADLGGRGFAFGLVADRHDHLGARGREALGDPETEATVGAGDDGECAGQIGNGQGEGSHGADVNRTIV